MPAFTEHQIPQGQGNIYARDYAGAEPAFVLLHGFPDNLHIYDELIPYLVAAGRRVVAFDFLGFGASEKPAHATYSFAQQIGDLRAVIGALNLGKIIPVGHDSSGMAAINFALDYPAQVASLCILNCIYAQTSTLRYPEFIELFANRNFKAFTQALMQSPEQFGWVLNFQRTQFARGLTDSQKAQDLIGPIIDHNFRQQPSAAMAFAQLTSQFNDAVAHNTQRLYEVETLDIPAQIIWGQRDPYLHPPLAEHLRAHLKHPDLHYLEAAHWLMLDAPAELAQLMLATRD
ncbi:MAG: alpha/beta fold hydrolase [Janthinobacterium lividum]